MKYATYAVAGFALFGGVIYFAVQGLGGEPAEVASTNTVAAAEAASGQAVVFATVTKVSPNATATTSSAGGVIAKYTSTTVPTNPPPAATNPPTATNPPAATNPPTVAGPTSTKAPATATSSVPTVTGIAPTAVPAVAGVPGVTIALAQSKLENEQDYRCETSTQAGYSTLVCDYKFQVNASRLTYNVQVYGSNATTILFMYSNVSQGKPDAATAVEAIGNIAALPFSTQPQLASDVRAWLATELPTLTSTNEDRVTNVGGIRYRLYGSPNSWFLEMGNPL